MEKDRGGERRRGCDKQVRSKTNGKLRKSKWRIKSSEDGRSVIVCCYSKDRDDECLVQRFAHARLRWATFCITKQIWLCVCVRTVLLFMALCTEVCFDSNIVLFVWETDGQRVQQLILMLCFWRPSIFSCHCREWRRSGRMESRWSACVCASKDRAVEM